MWTAENWIDYKLLDTADGERLESWGGHLVIRPDPQVIWKEKGDPSLWKRIEGHYRRSSSGGGEWEFTGLPKTWQISYRDLRFHLKPFAFKHTGVFPEQAANWDWMRSLIAKRKADRPDAPVRVLNLFAYTGGATLACLAEGASVTHVDASKGMVGWAKENAASSGLSERPVRWLVDDCLKFVQREIRRGSRYEAVIMDPPSYGRGPKGEIWKIEDTVDELIRACAGLLSSDALFFLVNSYTTGLQPGVLQYLLERSLAGDGKPGSDEPRRVIFSGNAHIVSGELGLPVESTGGILPCGCCGRAVFE